MVCCCHRRKVSVLSEQQFTLLLTSESKLGLDFVCRQIYNSVDEKLYRPLAEDMEPTKQLPEYSALVSQLLPELDCCETSLAEISNGKGQARQIQNR